jgi:primase-polymerase (primpol)-like protein
LAKLPHALQPLTRLQHWVNWKFVSVKGKWTKPPFNPRNTRWHAQNNAPKTWGSYEQALRASRQGDFAEYGGIGFNLLGADLAAFDLDKCRDPASGEIEPWALELVARAATYAEISPSGTGLRIIGKASPDSSKVHCYPKIPGAGHIEAYRRCERYITVTGLQIEGTPDDLADVDALMDELAALGGAVKDDKRRNRPRVCVAGRSPGSGCRRRIFISWRRIPPAYQKRPRPK